MKRRVLVCGSRAPKDMLRVLTALRSLLEADDVVITGGAHGTDAIAHEYAKAIGCETASYVADWDQHGKAAGPLRNQRMLEEGKPDIVLAFPGGKGTSDMVRRARAAGVRVVEVDL